MIRIMRYGDTPNSEIFARTNPCEDVSETVRAIISDVRARGDAALLEYTKRFDKADLSSLEVTQAEIDDAMAVIEPQFVQILRQAAVNIRKYHTNQKRDGFRLICEDGVIMGQNVIPVAKAGIYVPGGTAAYPSTVLMDSIPAKLAGVGEIIMVTPPGPDGLIPPAILAAANIAGIDRIFKVGGAQAVAALAYGTESIPRVDKIVGPGNAYVAEAKKQVYGQVSIDMIAGPSEIMIVADGQQNPAHTAADLLSQAEHDRNASAVLVTDSPELAEAVSAEIERQLPRLARQEIARASIDNNGKIIITDSISSAIDIANELAPEHLEICTDFPFNYLGSIKNAGSVFLGRNCPEALGDYMAGPNHTLPTGGTARFSSPLSVDDFIKKTQYTYFTDRALSAIGNDVAYFAKKEGLTGHAESVLIRTADMP